MDIGLRTFLTAEREKLSAISQLVNQKSPEFLKENHVFEFFAIRGYHNLIDAGAEIVRSIDPSTMSADLIPSVFEGWMDWRLYRPNMDNPFEKLIEQAIPIITQSLKRTGGDDKIFVFLGARAGIELNLRLGKALFEYSELTGNQPWAAVGRSIVVSALSLGDNDAMTPAALVLNDDGEILVDGAAPQIASARLYALLSPAYYPRAVSIGPAINALWTWTSASDISVSQENNILDISVSFPEGETHYMMIRGIRPFVKIQIYNLDYRTDPQFERYDSSGWVYSAADQILTLKMKHRANVEHIRIFY
jgi:hypothetical protein